MKGEEVLSEQEQAKIDGILQSHNYDKTLVIAIMQEVQKEYHYLPEEILSYIARELKLSEAKM